ncbi:MAG: type VII secretion protein EccE [Mycobacterium sp.]|nr:type VII secretion protein EccE [Mycobacterium sp.]
MSFMTRVAIVIGVLAIGLVGLSAGGYTTAVVGLVVGAALLAVPWRSRPMWSWAALYARRNRPIVSAEPVTVANDRSGGGVRYQDGVAAVAIQLLGKPYSPTFFTGSTSTQTRNTIDVRDLLADMHQSLGVTLESLTVISAGARRRSSGDYPRVYDTLIGTPPYAGQRETWLVIRLHALDNADALQWRVSVGTMALAAAQRIAAGLRCRDVRARVATAPDIVELERRMGRAALESHNQRWRTVRGDGGWLTTYAYRPRDVTTELLGQAWSLRADGVIQNVTVFPDGEATATLTVRTPQPPNTPPSVMLRPLPGEQASAVAAGMCGARPHLRGVPRGALGPHLVIPVGPSGILLGKLPTGERLLLPLADPGEFSRVHIAAEDSIAKRIIVRAAGAGDRITVHSSELRRWTSVRMPQIAVTDQARPASATTISVVDGTVNPAPRPNTVVSVGPPGVTRRGPADVLIVQTGPATVEVTIATDVYQVEVELFRAENRYVSIEPMDLGPAAPEPASQR